MFRFANDEILVRLMDIFNRMIHSGVLESNWQSTFFTMLSKSGEKKDPGNWRPVALLHISYKICSNLLHGRLSAQLESRQPDDQIGFRRSCGVDDAFVVLETVCSNSLEWNFNCWFASLDLKKAFDRIEHVSLFRALHHHGVDHEYVKLITMLYREQTGYIKGGRAFAIERGVRQGDVISPLFFNAGLELALERWKRRLGDCGLHVGCTERLTNVRYADALVLFAKSWCELVCMLEILIEELHGIGLALNPSKTKLFTTFGVDTPTLIEVAGHFLEVVTRQESHKYLGKMLSGNFIERRVADLAYRKKCAWNKFHKFKHILLNKHISLRLRLKFFDSVISPTILFGLATTALPKSEISKLDSLRRRMLRHIVGWARVEGETWNVTMRRMNTRLLQAQQLLPMRLWSESLYLAKFRLAFRVARANHGWPQTILQWDPQQAWQFNFEDKPCRSRGRPPTRWDDCLRKFVLNKFGQESWLIEARNRHDWLAEEQAFLNFCRML